MSFSVHINELDRTDKVHIEKTLVIDNKSVFTLHDSFVNIPFGFANERFRRLFNFPKPLSQVYEAKWDFCGQLRPEQEKIKEASLKSLEATNSVIIGAQPGFGKTITAINLLCHLNKTTLILVKQVMIMNQWLDALKEYAPKLVVQRVTGSSPLNSRADVYLMNPLLLAKASNTVSLKHVQLLIVDELHQVVSNVLHRSFFQVQPHFVIGLSATPRKPVLDPYDIAISWFFGKSIVGEQLHRKHLVYTYDTGWSPSDVKYTFKGLDWNHILTEQSQSVERNTLIIDKMLSFRDKELTWLILVKRVDQAEKLKALLAERHIECETLTRSKVTFNKDCKILIGTTNKIGVGFDHSPINALCVAADVVEYFEQFLGRCMRRVETVPIVLDFRDQFKTLQKHFTSRVTVYQKHGGIVTSASM